MDFITNRVEKFYDYIKANKIKEARDLMITTIDHGNFDDCLKMEKFVSENKIDRFYDKHNEEPLGATSVYTEDKSKWDEKYRIRMSYDINANFSLEHLKRYKKVTYCCRLPLLIINKINDEINNYYNTDIYLEHSKIIPSNYDWRLILKNKEEFKKSIMEEVKRKLENIKIIKRIKNESTNIFSEIEFI